MLNYALMTPVYLAKMYEMKEKDENIWVLLDAGGFSKNKSGTLFTAIGSDHSTEEENCGLKAIGGIKGIANSEVTLNEYFLTAAEMGNIVNNLCETGIDENQSRKWDEHHQLTEWKNARIEANCTELSHVSSEHDVTFEGQDSVYNIFTKKVVLTDVAPKEIKQTKYEEFVKEKREGEGSIWDAIKKEKIATFVSNNKDFTVTINNKLYQIKEERSY